MTLLEVSIYTKKKKLLILLGLAMSNSVVFLDSTILPVALPTIQTQFDISTVDLNWVISIYALVMSSLFLAGGKASDIIGHKRMNILGMILFGVASFFCGKANSVLSLLIFRAFQGLGGALMIPSSMALVVENFSPKERGRYIGTLVSFASIFLALGPFIGGWITQIYHWKYVFWINIPIIFCGIFIVSSHVPSSSTVKEPFDYKGCLLFVLSFVSIILGLMEIREAALLSSAVWIFFTLSVVFFIFLIKHIKNHEYPFIDYALFSNETFRVGNVIIFCAQFLLMIMVYWTIYFQKGLGYPPMKAGLFSLIFTFPVIFFAPLSGYLFDKLGPKIPSVIGFSMTFSAFLWFCLKGISLTVLGLCTGLALFGIGIAFVMTPIGVATVSAVCHTKKGAASGIYGTVRNSAVPFGIAIFGAIIANVSYSSFEKKIESIEGVDTVLLQGFFKLFSKTSLDALKDLSLSSETLDLLKKAFFEATGEAFFYCNILCAILSFIGLLLSLLFLINNKNKKSIIK